ncbi:helix-turn-helix transcriptional regulator [Pseudomonas sp. RIT-PI-AD]|uniref:helix-turn-helix domain-containing protein n=1 Tax=Pseudomonas sp. RIT-PI-AD TaxID=3035294 RepID=UPI0021DA1FB9|nr:helix-turn-helix transcriptional regulator [Pseudomonas sp. RIT-PI-AD]
MSVQVIMRDGQAEYAVLPWADYQALLQAAGAAPPEPTAATAPVALQRIGELREKLGLAQDQLARTVGISPAYLALIESGEREPDSAIQRALARALGVDGWEARS